MPRMRASSHNNYGRHRSTVVTRTYGTQMAANVRETALAPCWCEAKMLHVPLRDLRAGVTASCGKDECHG